MQRIMDAVSNGYTYYFHNAISVERCAKLVNKFNLNYHVLADRNERARRKRAGIGNAKLVLWLHNDVVYWWLLVTAPDHGDHAAHTIEILRDANSIGERIEVEGFELVRLPNKSNNKFVSSNTSNSTVNQKSIHLTWRMGKIKYQAWRESVIDEVRTKSARSIELTIYRLWTSPGFSGVRSQIGHIAALYKAEVKRTCRKDAPALPKHLGYVRRLSSKGITLNELIIQSKQPQASKC